MATGVGIIQIAQTAQRKTAIGELVGPGKVALRADTLRKHHVKMFLLVNICRTFWTKGHI
jgi:hypothetical protein